MIEKIKKIFGEKIVTRIYNYSIRFLLVEAIDSKEISYNNDTFYLVDKKTYEKFNYYPNGEIEKFSSILNSKPLYSGE